ncbi:MAG: hypothetical protein SOW92_04560 [Kiritimatiellia bacterium]|nr:hypothetical protein [Kiritimatiellia bacterium]
MKQFLKTCLVGALPFLTFAVLAQKDGKPVGARLCENTRVEWRVTLPEPGEFSIRTGRPGEYFSLQTRPDEQSLFVWRAGRPFGRQRLDGIQRVGGVSEPNFGWNPFVFAWDAWYRSMRQASPMSHHPFRVALELAAGEVRFFADGALLTAFPVTADLAGCELTVTAPKTARVSEPTVTAVGDAERFFEIDLSRKMAGEADLDIGRSWLMEGTLSGYEENCAGSFGGRWRGVETDTPSRLQFRVPKAPYKALHLKVRNDGGKDAIPFLNVVFYRPAAGQPIVFRSPDVPADGKVHDVIVPLDTMRLKRFQDDKLQTMELELTKGMETHVIYPDPGFHSQHQAGLPSALHVSAARLELADYDLSFEPIRTAGVFVERADLAVCYRVTAVNRCARQRKASFAMTATSGDGKATNVSDRIVLALRPFESKTLKLSVRPTRFGYHDLALDYAVDDEKGVYSRSFVWARARDTRYRGFECDGFMFGYWDWRGGHDTPSAADEIDVFSRLGFESTSRGAVNPEGDPAGALAMKKSPIRSYICKGNGEARGYGRDKEKSLSDLKADWERYVARPQFGLVEEKYNYFWAEPSGIGPTGSGTPPEFRGGDPLPLDSAAGYLACAEDSIRMQKRYRPDVKVMLPWGDPVFAVPFLRKGGYLLENIDGVCFDMGLFDLLPERQIHQVALHRQYFFNHWWEKTHPDGRKPLMVTIEGPCIMSARAGGLTATQAMNHLCRAALLCAAYGYTRQFSLTSLAECADYWGEQHYGGGVCSALPELNPYPAMGAVAMLVRQLRGARFDGEIDTGSTVALGLRFRGTNPRERKPGSFAVFWTPRGRRMLDVIGQANAVYEVYDVQDNAKLVRADKTGLCRLEIGESPVFVHKWNADARVVARESFHDDSVLAPVHVKLGDVGDLFSEMTAEADDAYVNNCPYAFVRNPVEMCVSRTNGTLVVSLPAQKADHGFDPYFSGFAPKSPIVIPGKATHVAMDVTAHGDWGRVVYVVDDAKGERWISCGTQGEWNCDDSRSESAFNFEGRRLVKVPLPRNAPYDRFRQDGSTTWGAVKGTGDGIADMPLRIVRLYVERRDRVMVVNGPKPASAEPVVLGGLWAEYAEPADRTEEAVRLDRLTMQLPPCGARHANPIAAAAATGELPAAKITAVRDPASEVDGTHGVVVLEGVPEGARASIWVSLAADGDDALCLARNVTGKEIEIRRLRPSTEFHAFVTYTVGKKTSKPSAPFKFSLKRSFGMR